VPCLPLVVSTSLLFPYVTGRNFAFRILTELLLIPLVVYGWTARRHLLRSPLALALLGFLACVGLADLLGVDPARSFWSTFQRMEGLLGLMHLVLFFFVLRVALATSQDWMRYFSISVAASAVVAVIALFQFATMADAGTLVRPSGPIGNAGILAAYLMLHVFLVLIVFLHQTRTSRRVLLLASLVLLIAAIYVSGTRSAVLALLVVGPVVALAWHGPSMWRAIVARSAPRQLVTASVALLAIGGLIAVSPLSGTYLRGFTGAGPSPRVIAWSTAWTGIRERLWTGWGQENFYVVWNRHMEYGVSFDRPHNVVLEWLFNGGVLAFGAGLVLMLAYARTTMRVAERDRRVALVLGGMVGAYVLWALTWLDTFDTYMPLVSAMAFADWYARPAPTGALPAPHVHAQPSKARQFPVAVLVVAVMAAVYVFNLRPMAWARDTVSAMDTWNAERDVARTLATFEQVLDDPALHTHEVAEQMAALVPDIVTARAAAEPQLVLRYAERSIEELRELTSRPPAP
jgi:O-antigen ligase